MIVKVITRKDFLRYLQPMDRPKGIFLLNIKFARLSTLLGLLFLLCANTAFSQDDLNIHGVISDAMSSGKIEGVKITVKKDGAVHDNFTTRANGKYEFYLDIGSRYDLIFEKEGFVERSIVIDSKNVPLEVVGAGIIMPTDMSMYEITPAMKDMDMSVFNKPIGIASYDTMEEDLMWDFEHTAEVKGEIFAFIRAVEKKEKELEKAADAEDKEAEALEAKFAQLVKDGDNAMIKKKYQDAVLNYKAALEIKADDQPVKAKLGDAEAKYEAEEAARKLDEDFNTALDAGDGYMRTEEYEKAIEKYEEALAIKAGESYPTEQIALATKTLEEQAANMANQEKFNQLMGEGDQFMTDKKYAEALVPFKEALVLMPGNREAQRKIDDAELAIQNAEAIAQKQADYDALLAEADAAFAEEKYAVAKTAYTNAKSILPDETYPGEQIVLCETKIAELANAEERQANYDAAMQKGNTAMTSKDFEVAIASFTEALTFISEDPDAKAKIAEAEGLLAELKAATQKQENYDALIAEADELLSAENYAESKEKYIAAKEIIPEEIYPTDQISKIDQIMLELAGAEATQKAYDEAMAAGRSAFDAANYAEAITQYTAALTAIPEDKDATKKLDEANAAKLEADANEATNAAYQGFIDAADAKFANEELEGAMADYRSALEVKNENYPTDQIVLIETMLAERANEAAEAERLAELQAAYDAHMKSGDEALTAERFADAVTSFEAALKVMADDVLAQSKLDEALTLQKANMDAAALEELYQAKIVEADASFEAKAYDSAIAAYTEAIEIKADEAYPKEQLAVIEEIKANELAAQLAADEAAKAQLVIDLILEGDHFVSEVKFQSALDKYEEALKLAPERTDIQAKIDKANELLLAYLEDEANNEAYAAAIAEGDKLFEQENWARSKSEYEKALEIKSAEEHPQNRIVEIEAKLAALAEQAELEKMKLLGEDFNKFIAEGDKRFSKGKYNKALTEYEAALTLMPDNQIAIDKVASVNNLLAEKAEAEANQKAYASLIEQGDSYFKEKNFEMAKLKYLDAQELMAEEQYPVDKVNEIEMLLEKQRLSEMADELAAIEAEYNEALRAADGFMNERNYVQAIVEYEDALKIKAEEKYPKSQLERIELLIKEEEAAELERQRLAALAAENASKPKRNTGSQNRVNTNSEDQAEQFMREAMEAQEREKYERVKVEKSNVEENLSDYESQSRTKRMAAQMSLEYYSTSNEEKYASAAQSKESQTKSSMQYKEALQQNQALQSEMGGVRTQYAHEQIQESASQRESWMTDLRTSQNRKIDLTRDEHARQLAQFEEQSRQSLEQKRAFNEDLQAEAASVYKGNKSAEDIRSERTKDVIEQHADRAEYQENLSNRNLDDIRAKAVQNKENISRYENDTQARSADKVAANASEIAKQRAGQEGALSDSQRLADARRQRSADELNGLQRGEEKDYDDYFRTQLADEYPQGVSEESSTLGNKVIITRIVVKGNHGDEYKKVVDKAGKYYFKNGQSISQNTWTRETILAFNESKD